MKTTSQISVVAVFLGMLFALGSTAVESRPPRHRRPVVVVKGRVHWAPGVRIVLGKPRVVRKIVLLEGAPSGAIDLDVEPETTKVFVDGTYRGTADDFDGHPQLLRLKAGPHHLRLVSPEGEEVDQKVTITPGTEIDLTLEL